MIIGRTGFRCVTIGWQLALTALLVAGCQTDKHDKTKQLATFRVHLEARDDDEQRTKTIQIHQEKPVPVIIEKEPFLTEAHVAEATVVEVMGGYDLRIRLNRQGTWLLQNYSASNPGRHYAIFSEFGVEKKTGHWLAAPSFSRLNSTGVLQFAPDVTREEAAQIALGLNNVVKKVKSTSQW
jgi:hypothetical protein